MLERNSEEKHEHVGEGASSHSFQDIADENFFSSALFRNRHCRKEADIYGEAPQSYEEQLREYCGESRSWLADDWFNLNGIGPVQLKEEMLAAGIHVKDYVYESSLYVAREKAPPRHCKIPHAFAIHQYSMQHIYEEVNTALREDDRTRFPLFTKILSQALYGYPPCKQITYRGLNGLSCDDLDLEEGNLWLNQQFLSSSTDKSKTDYFLLNNKKKQKLLFVIHGISGRTIDWMAVNPMEKEVLFPPFSIFEVTKIQKKKHWSEVHLKEIQIPTENDEKVLLLVDDEIESDENVSNICHAERNGVRVLTATSSKEAKEIIEKHAHLLERNMDGFRILSDMKRGAVADEGAIFAKYLQDHHLYNESIMFYVRNKDRTVQQLRSHELREQHYQITDCEFEAQRWCCYDDDNDRSKMEYAIYETFPVNTKPEPEDVDDEDALDVPENDQNQQKSLFDFWLRLLK